jgi:hypothetical protein
MQAGHLLASPPQYLRRIEVLAGFLEDFGNDPPLASHAEAMGFKLGRKGAALFDVLGKEHSSCE